MAELVEGMSEVLMSLDRSQRTPQDAEFP